LELRLFSVSWYAVFSIFQDSPGIHATQAFLGYRARYIIPNALLPSRGLPDAHYHKNNGRCDYVRAQGLSSCEDARFWDNAETGERRVMLSCDPGRFQWNTVLGPMNDAAPRGAIWLAGIDTLTPQKIELADFPDSHTFHPLGFELTPALSGAPSRLYVVNHERNASVVEEFEIEWDKPTQARWIRTLSDPALPAPNAITIARDGSLYVSNDHLFPLHYNVVLNKLETFLALPISHVVHVSFTSPSVPPTFSIAAKGIPFPNGVALSHDGDVLAVASCTGTSVRFYARNATTNSLSFTDEILVPFVPDNLSFDDDGAVLVAGHPDFPALIKMSKEIPGARAPSWVVAIRRVPDGTKADSPAGWDGEAHLSASRKVPRPPAGWEMETLYQSSGVKGFASSTTALRDVPSGRLFMSGLYEDGLLVCEPA
jgi:hypothetical protein